MNILLSFDVEEFDMPLEYGQQIPLEEQLKVGLQGLHALMPVWEQFGVTTTLFTTARFAQHCPTLMQTLAKKHEIASHTFYHSSFTESDLLASRLELERICGVSVQGLRMPRMRKVDLDEVRKAGYQYDSSMHPTWIPGRYNNLHQPRTTHQQAGLTILPASVSPFLRLPLFWLAFKNYPYSFFLQLCKRTLKKDGYLCLYFHPWEFTTLEPYQLPGYAKKIDGRNLLDRLIRLIEDLKPMGTFQSMGQYLKEKSLIE